MKSLAFILAVSLAALVVAQNARGELCAYAVGEVGGEVMAHPVVTIQIRFRCPCPCRSVALVRFPATIADNDIGTSFGDMLAT